MKIDFSQPLLDLWGKQLLESDDPRSKACTLESISVTALLAPVPDESGETRYKKYKIAQKIVQGAGVIEITPEDVTIIKAAVGASFGAAAVGPAFELLDG